LTRKYDVIHIRGQNNMACCCAPTGCKSFGYVDEELADLYAAADIMLSRAGATAVFEILALALPALLVPLPSTSSRGDQLQNARYFKDKGFAHILILSVIFLHYTIRHNEFTPYILFTETLQSQSLLCFILLS